MSSYVAREEGFIVRRMSEEEDAVEDGAMRSDDDEVKIKIKIMMVDEWDNGRDETWWSLRILL